MLQQENIKTAWIIDDDLIYVFAFRKLLSILNLCPNVVDFSNGKEAIDFLLNPANVNELPDVIFLDIRMPLMDGWGFLEAYQKIKQDLQKNIIIFMLSSSINNLDINRAKSISDLTDYLVKPISKEELSDIFKRVSLIKTS